jgi:hypothetical protein
MSFVKVVQELFGTSGDAVKLVRYASFESPGTLVKRKKVIKDLLVDVRSQFRALMYRMKSVLLDSRRPTAKPETTRASS